MSGIGFSKPGGGLTEAAADALYLALAGGTLTKNVSGSAAGFTLELAGTWNTTGSPTALLMSIVQTAFGANASLLKLCGGAGGVTECFRVTAGGGVEAGASYSTLTGVNAVLSGKGAFTLLGYSELWKVYLNNNEFGPWVDDEVSLGTAAKAWKELFVNGTIDGGSFKVGGVAGVSTTLTGVTTISLTIEGGLITSASGT